MIAKVAQIRSDHTWSEMEVRVAATTFNSAEVIALSKARAILGYSSGEYPENIIALHVLGVEEAKLCLGNK